MGFLSFPSYCTTVSANSANASITTCLILRPHHALTDPMDPTAAFSHLENPRNKHRFPILRKGKIRLVKVVWIPRPGPLSRRRLQSHMAVYSFLSSRLLQAWLVKDGHRTVLADTTFLFISFCRIWLYFSVIPKGQSDFSAETPDTMLN